MTAASAKAFCYVGCHLTGFYLFDTASYRELDAKGKNAVDDAGVDGVNLEKHVAYNA